MVGGLFQQLLPVGDARPLAATQEPKGPSFTVPRREAGTRRELQAMARWRLVVAGRTPPWCPRALPPPGPQRQVMVSDMACGRTFPVYRK